MVVPAAVVVAPVVEDEHEVGALAVVSDIDGSMVDVVCVIDENG